MIPSHSTNKYRKPPQDVVRNVFNSDYNIHELQHTKVATPTMAVRSALNRATLHFVEDMDFQEECVYSHF